MAISVFDLFKIGIGPSSSHTVGPMRAAFIFAKGLEDDDLLDRAAAVRTDLFGSLGATGKGHGSDKAVLLGLEGEAPEDIDPAIIPERLSRIREQSNILLLGKRQIAFDEREHLILHRRRSLPYHPNGMRFAAFDQSADRIMEDDTKLPFHFTTGVKLLELCAQEGMSVSSLMMENEKAWHSEQEIHDGLLKIWGVMKECVGNGCRKEGVLPGGMKVKRRAPQLYRKLKAQSHSAADDHFIVMDWVNLYALAVNEENAAGGRVVTAPTNGAAGIIPAVMHYYHHFCKGADEEGMVRFLLTAAAIGILYKENASISGAEVGCQGEVGSACSMAAGALVEVLGGTPEQVENAAEIGMEHNLGLTCDPVGGLVQVPCIERNAIASVKAINAARMALRGDGTHFVSLDKVIKTMRETGADMKTKYKETARGGLAVNVIEC
jgi:L-serine dehydratase